MKDSHKKGGNWFEEWFDSPFYHILYKNRNDAEAEKFITNLVQFLKPQKNQLFVDVACGKGRHSLFLNTLGYSVDGFDLSTNSIKSAQQKETPTLHFFVNDIRVPLKKNYYDFAFNLFTSFGYFDTEDDNQKAINAIAESLNEEGILVLDFMNAHKVIKNLQASETKTIDGIDFQSKRYVENGFIVQDISFNAEGQPYHYQELVKALTLNDFERMFAQANIQLLDVFGDYKLNTFNKYSSERLIMIFM